MTTIPVYPEPAPLDETNGYRLYAVTWLSANGELYTRLIGAQSADEAAATILHGVDITIRRFTDHASIDVRECGPVSTYKPKVVVL